jgi:hypothetical protein
VARGAGLAPVELGLDVGLADRQPRRTAVHHAADGRAVGFAEGVTQTACRGITGHGDSRRERKTAESNTPPAPGRRREDRSLLEELVEAAEDRVLAGMLTT